MPSSRDSFRRNRVAPYRLFYHCRVDFRLLRDPLSNGNLGGCFIFGWREGLHSQRTVSFPCEKFPHAHFSQSQIALIDPKNRQILIPHDVISDLDFIVIPGALPPSVCGPKPSFKGS